jgi:hypothetical protein
LVFEKSFSHNSSSSIWRDRKSWQKNRDLSNCHIPKKQGCYQLKQYPEDEKHQIWKRFAQRKWRSLAISGGRSWHPAAPSAAAAAAAVDCSKKSSCVRWTRP